jgi:hypothetical protein
MSSRAFNVFLTLLMFRGKIDKCPLTGLLAGPGLISTSPHTINHKLANTKNIYF